MSGSELLKEHEQQKAKVIEEFITEFLSEKGIVLADHITIGCCEERLIPSDENIKKLIHEFFENDYAQSEVEAI